MLHLSLLTLPRSAGRWRFLTSYQLHQLLWRGFPGIERGEQEQRFLYRHDEGEDKHSILVQSAVGPDWSFLDDEAEGTTSQVRDFDPDRMVAGDRLRFFVRVNPVVKRKYEDGSARHIAVGSDRKRIGGRLGKEMPSREEMLIEWLQRKGSEGGFNIERDELDRPLCMASPNRDLVIRNTRSEKPITFTGIDFEGILRLTDSTAFANILRHGIGRGKGFGFGLLSVRRV